MTVSSQVSSVSYLGDGVTTLLPVPFYFLEQEHLLVIRANLDGSTQTLILGSDYSVSGAGNQAGGSVTMFIAPESGIKILIERSVPATQETDYVANDPFPAESHERALDKLTMLVQQSSSNLRGAIRVAVTDPEPDRLPPAASRANLLMGFDSAGNPIPVSPVDGSVADFALDLANATDANKGAKMVGYIGRTVREKLLERIDVTDHWQLGDASWSDAIDRCIAIAESASSTTTFPYTVPRIWFPRSFDPDGTYGILRPIHSSVPLQFDGDNARIVALPGFVGKTIPLAAGGTEVNKSMMIFLNGSKGTTAGQLRWRAKVSKGIILDCQDTAFNGIYIERMPYSNIDCEIQFAAADGVQVGPWCWGLGSDEAVIENSTAFGMHFLKDSACNGMSIRNPRIWGEFKTSQGGLLFDQDAEANGVSITGGFIEKVAYGVLIGSGNGPININGVDFEQCTFACVRAAAGVFTGQKIGPIDVENCFLHTTAVGSSKIYADHATVNVTGCRLYPGTIDFETDAFSRGIINAKENRYMAAGTVGLGPNVSLSYAQNDGSTKEDRNYLPQKTVAFTPTYAMKNYAYRDAPTLQSSGFSFAQNYQGGATGRYLGFSEWFTAEYRHVSAPGVLHQRIGLRLANDTGQNAVQPLTDGGTSCGSAAARWTEVWAFNATIQTSDGTAKQQIRDVDEAEKRVAIKLKGMVKAYKMNAAVEAKGDKARTHFGWIAQEVEAVFREEGLDPWEYSLLCYDEWPDVWRDVPEVREPVLTEDWTPAFSVRDRSRPILGADGKQILNPPGQPTFDEEGQLITRVVKDAARELVYAGGSSYGIRYEQLIAFIFTAE